VLGQNPFSGHVFCFRGRRRDLLKLLWWDGDGLCLLPKRLERGRFVSPRAEEGGLVPSRGRADIVFGKLQVGGQSFGMDLELCASNCRHEIDAGDGVGIVGSPMKARQLLMGIWLVRIAERRP
jgi:hypothetical protein